MANPQLTQEQLSIANAMLDELRNNLRQTCGENMSYLWALRRKIAKELIYDERGKPSQRRRLKAYKRKEQQGLCPTCGKPLPETYCILDRFVAEKGYTVANTRLLCQPCDIEIQTSRGYK